MFYTTRQFATKIVRRLLSSQPGGFQILLSKVEQPIRSDVEKWDVKKAVIAIGQMETVKK